MTELHKTELEVSHAKFVPGRRNGRSGTSQHGPGQAPFGFLVSVANPTFFLTGVSTSQGNPEHPQRSKNIPYSAIAVRAERAQESSARVNEQTGQPSCCPTEVAFTRRVPDALDERDTNRSRAPLDRDTWTTGTGRLGQMDVRTCG